MATVSLAMIVRDEARTIERVLSCASEICDEMIVVDTGSSDRTVELAQSMGATVFHFPWVDDFAAARNFSFDKCAGDWILWLDADDVLPDSTIKTGYKIKEYLDTAEINSVFCPYHYAFAEEDPKQPVVVQSRERFIRRAAGLKWVGKIHESLVDPDASFVLCPEFVVEHRTAPENMSRKKGRNLSIFENTINIETCSTRELYLYAEELRGAGKYEKAIEVFQAYFKRYPENMRDLFDEPYMARCGMLEVYRALEDPIGMLRVAAQMIAHDASRAEGYGQMAAVHYRLGNYASAFPLFLAAAACKPPSHGGVYLPAFYSSYIHDMIKECKAKLVA